MNKIYRNLKRKERKIVSTIPAILAACLTKVRIDPLDRLQKFVHGIWIPLVEAGHEARNCIYKCKENLKTCKYSLNNA